MERRGESRKDAFWLTANALDVVIVLAEVDTEIVISEVAEINGADNGFIVNSIFRYEAGAFISENPPTAAFVESVAASLKGSTQRFRDFVHRQWDGQLTVADSRNRSSSSKS